MYNEILQGERRQVFRKLLCQYNHAMVKWVCGFLFVGVFGSGTGVILVANIIYDHAEIFSKEMKMQEEQNTMLF